MEVQGILGVLILFADILKIFQSGAGVGVKAAWIVAVILLPVLGLIIWFFFGPGNKSS
jgi:hypothetical protein